MLAGFLDGRADEGVGAGPATLLGSGHRPRARVAGPRDPGAAVTTQLTPMLTALWDQPRSWTLETYERHGGYARAQEGPGYAGRPTSSWP